jgi:gamma-glutamyltranspeptidase/glutathione hydrolase
LSYGSIETWKIRKPAVHSKAGVVVAQHHRAAAAGARVLADGGNAVDAAVATSLAVGVLEPWMSGLGGGGYMVVHLAAENRTYAVEFGMKASMDLDPQDYPLAGGKGPDLFAWPAVIENRNISGPYSVAVPGLVAGLELALESFGSQPWSALVEPAIALANQGLEVDWFATLKITSAAWDLARHESSRRIFLPHGYVPVAEWSGVVPRIPLGDLAGTLARLALQGPRDFYRGAIAADLVADADALGIRLTAADLHEYRAHLTPVESFPYRGCEVDIVPGLTAGPSLRKALASLENAWEPSGERPDASTYLNFARCLDDAYQHRFAYIGDVPDGYAPPHTTHVGVVDRDGNTVALTQTLLSLFGSKVILPRTGILMNNGVMWFDPRPDRPNSMQPGKRPLSNMCPVVLKHKDGRRFALGAAGGRRIMPAVFQLISFLTDFGMDVEAAAHYPRIDASGTDYVTVDAALGPEICERLADEFATRVVQSGVYPNYFACPNIACWEGDGSSSAAAFVPSPWAGAAVEA